MEKILKSYLRKLTNLSGNNRSLLLLRLLQDQLIDIHDFDFARNKPSFFIIDELLQQRNSVTLCENIDPYSTSTQNLSKRLRRVQRTEQFIFQERGAKDLYIGWPFVRGKFKDGTRVRCPLIFFPVEISLQQNEWVLSKRKDVNITLNKTFLLAYSYYNEVPVAEELVEVIIDDYHRDSTLFRTQLYELLRDSNLEIHFNQENFMDELKSFKYYNKEGFEQEHRDGILKLYPEAVLGIFPQSGSYLVPDYKELIENNHADDLETFFYKKKVDEVNQRQVLEENTFTPFPLDAYQEKALQEIKKGNSIVVQGPPGTGKSQLISNLICDFMARGKTVLMVCQKRAALDVVYERLKEKSVQDFVALVHDFKSDRKSIYEQVNTQIEQIDSNKQKNNSLDAIQLERSFLKSSRRIDQIIEELEEFKEALFDESECGKSAKELYLISNPDEKSFDLNYFYRSCSFEVLPIYERKFSQYLAHYERFEKRSHFWAKGPSFATFGTRELQKLLEILAHLIKYDEEIKQNTAAISSQSIDFETVQYFSDRVGKLEQLDEELNESILYKIYRQLHEDKPTKETSWLIQIERTMMACFRGSGMETSIKSAFLGRFQEILESALQARQSPFQWIKWRLFSKEKHIILEALNKNKLKSSREGLNTLVERIDNRLNFEHCVSEILDNNWLHNFPFTFRKIEIQDWFFWQKAGLKLYYLTKEVHFLNEYIPVKNHEHESYKEKLQKLIRVVYEVQHQLSLWYGYVNIHQVRAVILKREDTNRLIQVLKRDFDAICEYHKLKDSLSREDLNVLDTLSVMPESRDQKIAIFRNSICLAWIDHIEIKHPVLRLVSSGKLSAMTKELKEEILNKLAASKQILMQKAREKTYDELNYNRLNNRVSYRDLQHQVTKKRRVWPIRRVIGEYQDELFKILPCWMCSPESASAIFPMTELFDLVIFDEASQCFSERGIPAMYRGRQVVIAGDEKQLQPSDLYRARWDEDDDETPELSIQSLLDLSRRYLPQVQLSGHYRSSSLELIDFSNEHFYDGKLRLLPNLQYVNRKIPAISFHKVDGVWRNGVNEVEADAVVDFVAHQLEEHPEKELGVVTFNFKQQSLIQEKLETLFIQKHYKPPNSFFIKNIENVQGDEKDIIVFSVGYAPDERGKLRAQFGSFNLDGGENRLNVAVTRAREKVVVFSSIYPEQLSVEEAKHAGPKLLKKYLEYAIQVNEQKWSPHLPRLSEHATSWYLRNQLIEVMRDRVRNEIQKDLPFTDLSIKQKSAYLGLILTDDERYFNALSPKQIYAFQDFHLEMKGWPNVRIHSREFWINREEVTERLIKFIYQAANGVSS